MPGIIGEDRSLEAGDSVVWTSPPIGLSSRMWTNFHTHSSFCDGKASLQEMFDSAQDLGLLSLGFSSHAPLPFFRPWAMKAEDMDNYLKEISEITESSKRMEVYAGLEVDFIPGRIGPSYYSLQLDYTIGSVHFVDTFPDGEPWEIDNTHAVFMRGVDEIFKGDVKAGVCRYFEVTREMLELDCPTILGHLDKIKMHNRDGELFDEGASWYTSQIDLLIEAILRSGVIVEVNTRGKYQNKTTTTYPGLDILTKLASKNIPVTINSDAHHPKDLVNGFVEAVGDLRRAGFKEIMILHEGKWQPTRFNERGIC